MPKPAPRLPDTRREGAAAVYFPSCTNRIMGRSKRAAAGPSLPDALVAVSARAGLPVWIPPDVAGHCCGVPFSSKGHRDAHAQMAARTTEALWRWTDEGALPIVCDASSCTLGLGAEAVAALPEDLRERHAKARDPRLRRVARAAAAGARGAPQARAGRRPSRPARPATSASPAGSRRSPATLADEVVVPVSATCCGFAGDRGMLHPELTASATAPQAAELAERGPFDAYISTNRTCEIGLERATGEPYGSIVQALEELTR